MIEGLLKSWLSIFFSVLEISQLLLLSLQTGFCFIIYFNNFKYMVCLFSLFIKLLNLLSIFGLHVFLHSG